MTVVCVCTCNCCTGVKSSEEFAFVTEEDLSKRRRVRSTSDPASCHALQGTLLVLMVLCAL